MGDWKQDAIKTLRTKLPPNEVDDWLSPKRIDTGHANISSSYHSYIGWAEIYNHGSMRGTIVDINSYRYQRNRHIFLVKEQLNKIRERKSGKSLLKEIAATNYTLQISPLRPSDAIGQRTGVLPIITDANGRSLVNYEDATPAGKPILDGDGNPKGGSGTGRGSDAVLWYSVGIWGAPTAQPDSTWTGTGDHRGPGSNPDEVLFHELVHVARVMQGLLHRPGMNGGYHNEEEFIAVMITNIYLSEKGQKVFRGSHGRFNVLENPDSFFDNTQQTNPSPSQILKQLRKQQTTFFTALADISSKQAAFNPVRQYEYGS